MSHSEKRRTKIIATLGPATSTENKIKKLLQAGVDAFRLNFSHGTIDEHAETVKTIRKVAESSNKQTCVIADLQGPKIRIANFKQDGITLVPGDHFIFDALLDEHMGDQSRVGITYKNLPKDVAEKDVLLVDDGRLVFIVEAVKEQEIHCRVKIGGILSNHKGINRQGGGLSAEALTEKDRTDLSAALSMGVDYIALSFPRNANDVNEAKALIKKELSHAGLIAKIERCDAVDAIDEIIEAADAVMVARGDLGVEIGDAKVPAVQKQIIQRARELNKAVITATQMLESMVHSPIPTRAEVSDVANAVLDGTDAVMLSAETATGEYPEISVETMENICATVEKYPNATHRAKTESKENFDCVDEAIAVATMYTANHLPISAIIALTESGKTPLRMSRIDTAIPIYALTRHVITERKMNLFRGVYPIAFDPTTLSRSEINKAAIAKLQKKKCVMKEDKVIVTKGDFIGKMGWTNALKILSVD